MTEIVAELADRAKTARLAGIMGYRVINLHESPESKSAAVACPIIAPKTLLQLPAAVANENRMHSRAERCDVGRHLQQFHQHFRAGFS